MCIRCVTCRSSVKAMHDTSYRCCRLIDDLRRCSFDMSLCMHRIAEPSAWPLQPSTSHLVKSIEPEVELEHARRRIENNFTFDRPCVTTSVEEGKYASTKSQSNEAPCFILPWSDYSALDPSRDKVRSMSLISKGFQQKIVPLPP